MQLNRGQGSEACHLSSFLLVLVIVATRITILGPAADAHPGMDCLRGFSLDENTNNGIYLRADDCISSWAHTAMHEMGHNLGAIASSAPRWDSTNTSHPTDENDVMAYGAGTSVVCSQIMEGESVRCNDNDYFDLNPGSEYLANHWNIARNEFLVG
jgi:hypothetical protein